MVTLQVKTSRVKTSQGKTSQGKTSRGKTRNKSEKNQWAVGNKQQWKQTSTVWTSTTFCWRKLSQILYHPLSIPQCPSGSISPNPSSAPSSEYKLHFPLLWDKQKISYTPSHSYHWWSAPSPSRSRILSRSLHTTHIYFIIHHVQYSAANLPTSRRCCPSERKPSSSLPLSFWIILIIIITYYFMFTQQSFRHFG